jgi:hypothetical protein
LYDTPAAAAERRIFAVAASSSKKILSLALLHRPLPARFTCPQDTTNSSPLPPAGEVGLAAREPGEGLFLVVCPELNRSAAIAFSS